MSEGGLRHLPNFDDEAEVADWLRLRRAALLQAVPKPRTDVAPHSVAAALSMSVPPIYGVLREKYAAAVDAYLRECRACLPNATIGSLVRSDYNKLTVRVTNPTDDTISSIRLVADVPYDQAHVYVGPPTDSRLPITPDGR